MVTPARPWKGEDGTEVGDTVVMAVAGKWMRRNRDEHMIQNQGRLRLRWWEQITMPIFLKPGNTDGCI